ncbi:MAG: CBS domain-containing protein [Planctomycetota bacterium]|jgi:CBS domain-containing protein
MHTVRQILQSKGSDIWSIAPQGTAYKALQIMADKEIGVLLVIDGGKLVGIFSERDYARKVILKGKSSKETSVGELMTQEVYYIDPGATMEDCMALMTAKQIRHLPVMENEKLIGIVTLGDVVNQVISDQKVTIRELEKYITGGYEA